MKKIQLLILVILFGGFSFSLFAMGTQDRESTGSASLIMSFMPLIFIIAIVLTVIFFIRKRKKNQTAQANQNTGRINFGMENGNVAEKQNIRFCTNCGNALDQNARFCAKCGQGI